MSEQAFPPEDPASFLSLCDGEWMSLRSCFELAAGADFALSITSFGTPANLAASIP